MGDFSPRGDFSGDLVRIGEVAMWETDGKAWRRSGVLERIGEVAIVANVACFFSGVFEREDPGDVTSDGFDGSVMVSLDGLLRPELGRGVLEPERGLLLDTDFGLLAGIERGVAGGARGEDTVLTAFLVVRGLTSLPLRADGDTAADPPHCCCMDAHALERRTDDRPSDMVGAA